MRQNSFNQTAYRILRLLEWLIETPLSLEQINQRFSADPQIGKTLSQDSIGLYMNTLKAVGCDITRPSPKNNFQYTLTYHPFSYVVTPDMVEFLKGVRHTIEGGLGHWEILHFNHWLSKVFHYCANENRQELEETFFKESRIVDFDSIKQQLQLFERFIQEGQLIEVTYESPAATQRTIALLPQKLMYQQGVFYVLGQTADYDQPSMLRLDRIFNVTAIEDTPLLDELANKQLFDNVYIIRILGCTKEQYEPFDHHDEVMQDPLSPGNLLVKIQTLNDFLLKQKLLNSGYFFQVLYPERFKHDCQNTLDEMRALYT